MTSAEGLDRLTFTRFVAAFAVLCFHLGHGVPLIDNMPWSGIVMAGPVAVTYFFTLSGFIMAVIHDELRPEQCRDFWRARLARIYPVYLLGLAFSIRADSDPVGWLLSLGLVQAWIPGYALSANLVGWSLSIEMAFYLAFPFLILLARRVGIARWCGLVAIGWLASQAWAVFAANHIVGPYRSPSYQFVHYSPLTYLNCFVIGIAAGLLVRRGHVALNPRQARRLLLGALAVAAALMLTPWAPMVPRTMGLLAPLFGSIIIALYWLPSKWRPTPFARLLGDASYALYVLHWPVSRLLQITVVPMLDLSAAGTFCFEVAVLIGLSILVFRHIETPLRAALRRKTPTGKHYHPLPVIPDLIRDPAA